MAKKGFIFILVFVLVFSAINLYLFYNQEGVSGVSYSSISARVIKGDSTPKLPLNLSLSTLAFTLQWIILLIIVFIAYLKFLKSKKEQHLKISYEEIKKKKKKSETDIDYLYRILKDKKKLGIDLIAKTFKINKEKALEWSKILENYGLATIEYPAFSEPELRVKEENDAREASTPERGEVKGGKEEKEAKTSGKDKEKLKGKGKEERTNKKNKEKGKHKKK